MTRRLLINTRRTVAARMLPSRNNDWEAVVENYEPGDLIGHGPTEGDAVLDLYAQIDDLEAEDQQRYEYETEGKP